MLVVKNVKDYEKLEEAINFIHGAWGNENNYLYFKDAIDNSGIKTLPQFYVLLKDEKIIGCCGLITNDFISRHDLYPWVSSLYIEKDYRGHEYGNMLMEHAEKDAKSLGFKTVYLTTDHDGFYERYDWKRIEDGIDLFSGELTRIYMKSVS